MNTLTRRSDRNKFSSWFTSKRDNFRINYRHSYNMENYFNEIIEYFLFEY